MRRHWLVLACASTLSAQATINFDNDRVRVLSVVDAPDKRGGFHEHKMNRVMIYLDDGADKLTYRDGKVQDVKFSAGEVLWSPISGVHRSENASGKAGRIVEIELKKPGKPFTTGALDPLKVAPGSYKIVFENDQVRVVRAHIAAHAKVPLHEHSADRVVVYLTPYKLRVMPEHGSPMESTGAAADVRFAPPARHAEENLSDAPFEVVAVELK